MAEVAFEIDAASIYPATEEQMNNTIGAEEMPISYNCLGKMRKHPYILIAALVGIVAIVVSAILIINYVWKLGSLHEEDVHIQSMYVDLHTINDNIVTFGGNATLPIDFKISGAVEPSMVGYFTLSTSTYKFRPIIATSTSTFHTTPTNQVIVVRFEQSETYLPEDEMAMFRKMLDANRLWIKLNGDFKWRRKGTALYVKDTKGHDRFRCEFPYKSVIDNKFYSGACNP